jgi:hypothetical protein
MAARLAAASLLPGDARAVGVAAALLAVLTLALGIDGAPAVLIGSLPYPGAVAIDGPHAYVTNHDMSVSYQAAGGDRRWGASNLFEVPVAGGAPRRRATLSGQPITDLAVGPSTLYFTCAGGGTVSSLSLATLQIHPIASGQQEPWAIAVDRTHVYFTTRGHRDQADGTVVRVPAAGGPLEVIASGLSAPMYLALDDASVYVTVLAGRAPDYRDSAILAIPKHGGSRVVLAAKQDPVRGLAADGASIYWTSTGNRPAQGQVFRLDRAGGRPVVLAAGEQSTTALAIDQAGVFWTCYRGTVRRVGKQGGRPTTLVRWQDRPVHIAVGPAAVVWSNYGKADGEMDLPGDFMALRR